MFFHKAVHGTDPCRGFFKDNKHRTCFKKTYKHHGDGRKSHVVEQAALPRKDICPQLRAAVVPTADFYLVVLLCASLLFY